MKIIHPQARFMQRQERSADALVREFLRLWFVTRGRGRPRSVQNASALVMTLVTGVLVGTVLGSYLVLINNRNQSAMRAMAWNSAIPVLEAGIEEALTHFNEDRINGPDYNFWRPSVVN